MLDKISAYVSGVFNEFVEFFTELPIKAFDGILGGIASIIEAIPTPDILQTNITTYIPSDIAWLLVQSSFPQCLTIIGGGVVFYFFRRVLTLGIW